MDVLAIDLVQYNSPASLKIRHRRNTKNEKNNFRMQYQEGVRSNHLNNPLDLDPINGHVENNRSKRTCKSMNANGQRISPTFINYASQELENINSSSMNSSTSNIISGVGGGILKTPQKIKRIQSNNNTNQAIRFNLKPDNFYNRQNSNPNLEALTVGSNGLMKSASTINFLQFQLDQQMTNNLKARSNEILRHMNSPQSPIRKGQQSTKATLPLGKIVVPMMDGIESIVDDGFQKCFERRIEPSWNYVWYLAIPWCFGVVFRCFILFYSPSLDVQTFGIRAF